MPTDYSFFVALHGQALSRLISTRSLRSAYAAATSEDCKTLEAAEGVARIGIARYRL